MSRVHARDLGLSLVKLTGGSASRVAIGRIAKPKMNKTEAAYAARLDALVRDGVVLWWAFEAITLKLADDTRYTPDFTVMLGDGSLTMHETKGFMRDDARVKLQVAARMFPFAFYLVKLDAGEWNITEVKP